MQITQILSGETLLTYSMATTPSPLQVSPQSGSPSVASINFIVSCPVDIGEATVKQIAFNLPIGDPAHPESTDLTLTATGISASVSSSGKDQWQIGPGAAAGSFVLKPASGNTGKIDAQGITVAFTGIQVSPIVGTAVIKIVEVATSDSTPPSPRTSEIAAPKFPYGFFAGDLQASAPMVDHGGKVTLTWVGSTIASYKMLWAKQSLDVSQVRSWPSPALTDTTTFILQVTAQEAGQTVTVQFSTTVIVANPDFTATTLTVLQTSTLKGNVTIGGSPAANLNVGGAATASTVNAGALNVSGNTTLAALNVSGIGTLSTLNVNGAANLSRLTVAGQLLANGHVSMFKGAQSIGAGNYASYTDGIVIGHVGNGGQDVQKKSWARAYAGSGGAFVETIGGNTVFWGDGSTFWFGSAPSSFALAVRQGDGFYTGVQRWDGAEFQPVIQFFWCPLGNPAASTVTIKKLSNHPPKNAPGAKPSPVPAMAERPDPSHAVGLLATTLNRALKGSLSATDRQRFEDAVMSLVCASRRAKPKPKQRRSK
jgi:hypothetical protein